LLALTATAQFHPHTLKGISEYCEFILSFFQNHWLRKITIGHPLRVSGQHADASNKTINKPRSEISRQEHHPESNPPQQVMQASHIRQRNGPGLLRHHLPRSL
jgi:hypothetical protein